MALTVPAEWVDLSVEAPPIGKPVMGLTLQRYLNKPSDWGVPYIFMRTDLGYGGLRPHKWLRVALPPVPPVPTS